MDTRRRTDLALLVAALALAATSIAVGFCTDDYGFRAVVRAHPRAAVDLFRFATGDAGTNLRRIAGGHLPWWTAADFRLHLIRPLTGLLFAADVALFGDAPLGYHLHSLAWYALLLLGAASVFRRTLPARAATFALAVYALRAAHVLPYAWIAARHVVVGGALATWALALHLRATRTSWRAGHALGPALLILALAASEAALGAVALWIALDLAAATRGTWRRAQAHAAPALAIAVVYLALYRAAGGGARASGAYHDPLREPAAYAASAVRQVPILLADAWAGVPVFLATRIAPALVAIGAVAAAVAAVLVARARDRARWAWYAGALFGVLVGAAGILGGRVLLVPDLGFAALLGTALAAGFDAAPARLPGARALACLLAALHLAFAPLVSLVEIAGLHRRARATDAIALGAEIPHEGGARVFVLAASDPYVFLYPRAVLADRAPGRVACWSVLSAAAADHRLERVDARTLRLGSEGRPLAVGFDALFRGPDRPFVVGDEVRQCGAVIRVEAAVDGRATRILVRFERPLEPTDGAPDRRVFLVWNGTGLVRLTLPAIGASVELPWSRGPAH